METKYAVVQCSNGGFRIISEHGTDLQAARVAFHDRCKILWNAPDVIEARVGILDSNLTYVDGHIEAVSHPVAVEETEEVTG